MRYITVVIPFLGGNVFCCTNGFVKICYFTIGNFFLPMFLVDYLDEVAIGVWALTNYFEFYFFQSISIFNILRQFKFSCS